MTQLCGCRDGNLELHSVIIIMVSSDLKLNNITLLEISQIKICENFFQILHFSLQGIKLIYLNILNTSIINSMHDSGLCIW